MATLLGVELAKVGTWDTSTGIWSPTASDFAAAVAAQHEPDVRAPVVKIGHTDPRFDGEPALGSVRNLRTTEDGQTLIGDILGMPTWLADSVRDRWPSRSVECSLEATTASGNTYAMVLDAVALLGVTAPGVTGLADLPALIAASKMAARLPAERRIAASMAAPTPHSIAQESRNTMTDTRTYTPAVLKVAMTYGVDLATVQATGPGGRVSLRDVEAAAAPTRAIVAQSKTHTRAEGVAAASGQTVEVVSRFTGKRIQLNPRAANPLVDDLRISSPSNYALAKTEATMPTLFESGDTPPFCGTDIDPRMLLQLPWQARHPAARETNRARAMEIFEACAGPYGDAEAATRYGADPDNQEYFSRVRQWASGQLAARDTYTGELKASAGSSTRASAEDDAYRALYPAAEEDARSAAIARASAGATAPGLRF
ncbi:E3 binding domain-containing protein [Jatrophihabitans sp. DSM 45814]